MNAIEDRSLSARVNWIRLGQRNRHEKQRIRTNERNASFSPRFQLEKQIFL